MSSRTARDQRRRALGQNFLTDDRAIAAIVGTLHPPPASGDVVIDIGAGNGALTAAVAATGARVVAIERDPHWARVLGAHAASWGSVEVVRGDALRLPFPAGPFRVISSAPYGLGTQLVRRLMTDAHGLQDASIVLQAETARRLAGQPACGRFAATWAPWFSLRVALTIDRRAFRPIPSVDGAVLRMKPRKTPLLSPAAFPDYTRFLDATFDGRPRTVGERLARRLGRPRANAVCAAAGVDRTTTPSALAPATYAALFAAQERSAYRSAGRRR